MTGGNRSSVGGDEEQPLRQTDRHEVHDGRIARQQAPVIDSVAQDARFGRLDRCTMAGAAKHGHLADECARIRDGVHLTVAFEHPKPAADEHPDAAARPTFTHDCFAGGEFDLGRCDESTSMSTTAAS